MTGNLVGDIAVCALIGLVITIVVTPLTAASLRKEARALVAHLGRPGVTVVPLRAMTPTYRGLSRVDVAAGSAFADNAFRTRILAMMIGPEGISIWKSGTVPAHLASIPAEKIRRIEVKGGAAGNRLEITVADKRGAWVGLPLFPISFRGLLGNVGKAEVESIAAALPSPTAR